jgi:SAM-dependent methyltransferase
MSTSNQIMQPEAIETNATSAERCPSCGHDGAENWLQAPDRFHGRPEIYQLLRCPGCSLVWLKDPPSPEEMGNHYGPDYDRAIAGTGDDPNHWTSRRDTLLRYKTGGAILDLGCSSGGFLTSVKSPAWKLYGIEMSDSVARRAEANCGAEVFVGDILDAPFAPGSFDAITCFHVFEHLYHPREVLEKVAKWLKPGGIFFTMMPNIDSAGAHIFKSHWYALELPRHLSHFSPTSLRNMANSVGLEEVSLTTDREVFIEYSTRYVLEDALKKIGISRVPLARAKRPSLAWRVVRKMFRLTVLPVLNGMASLAGDGESIHVVLKKGTNGAALTTRAD